uniref:polymeric immunoglobulin receptor-like isoform X1 n=1 Tax=Oncorhynchus gorbuscha TaxID=8017 RepID=UPI001EAF65E6|nr:polymeric immunoglobulin receptor-like isoform X1 [Oncorhynchus gorbuscha]XP_046216337.1 polymeric immunoglobulin receptor-like isoform X2 [Oncorhynchus gorbuscha]
MVILLVLTLKVVLLLAAMWSVCSAELITVEGYEGGKAEIRCPYREEWRSHQKYLCKGDCPVFNKDKVIKTEAGENSASNGRYSLKDNREESVFIVTITNLTFNDAGKYWCGVDTWGQDNYIKVNLEVSEDWCCENPAEVTGSEEVTGYEEQSVSIHCMYNEKNEDNEKYFCKANTLSKCLVDVKVTTTKSQNGRFSLFDNRTAGAFTVTITRLTQEDAGRYLCGVQNNHTTNTLSAVQLVIKTDSSAPRVNTDTGINREGCHGDGNYEEIEDCPLQFSSGGETTTIYATANLPTSTSDSLNYANVNFHKVPSCPKEATVAIAKEGTSPGYYATVNHPHSTSEAPPIYYTVSKPRDA